MVLHFRLYFIEMKLEGWLDRQKIELTEAEKFNIVSGNRWL